MVNEFFFDNESEFGSGCYATDELRKIERRIFQNEQMNLERFPTLDSNLQMEMAADLGRNIENCNALIYAYFVENDDDWYIDVYFHERTSKTRMVSKRFIIEPGKIMSAAEEKAFLKLWREYNYAYFSKENRKLLKKKVKEKMPNLKLKEKSLILNLIQIYFATQKCGLRGEMFRVGGLSELALALDEIESMNLLETDISKAFGGIEKKMLRKLNSAHAAGSVLRTEERRKIVKELSEVYPYVLDQFESLNEFQVYYLADCMDKKDLMPDVHFMGVLADLETRWDSEIGELIDGYDVYEDYLLYMRENEETDPDHFIFPAYPTLEEDSCFSDLSYFKDEYVKDVNSFAEMLEQKYKEQKERYAYEDIEFFMVVPHGTAQLWDYSHKFSPLYYDELVDFAEGKMDFVFLFKKNKPTIPAGYIAIKEKKIYYICVGAYKEVSDKMNGFLQKFAKEKGLEFRKKPDFTSGFVTIPSGLGEELPFQ